MDYSILIIKDKFSNNEKEIYKTTLESSINIRLIIEIIKRFDNLEQHLNNIEDDL